MCRWLQRGSLAASVALCGLLVVWIDSADESPGRYAAVASLAVVATVASGAGVAVDARRRRARRRAPERSIEPHVLDALIDLERELTQHH